ncbi:MAG: hypothetical protein ABEL76_01140 [Bradymonadaceae bacterium]
MVGTHRSPALLVAAAVALLALGVGLLACGDSYNFDRPDYERGTLGEELFRIWRKDAARARHNPEEKVELLDRRREAFVDSVDTTAPPGEVRELDFFLREANRTVRSGVLPSLTRKITVALRGAAEDDRLLRAMAPRVLPPVGSYLQPGIDDRLLGHIVATPKIRDYLTTSNELLLGADGHDAFGRPASGESTAFLDLQRALADGFAESEEGTGTPAMDYQRTLLASDSRYGAAGGSSPVWIVRYDRRGYPRVRPGSDGRWFPFRDANTDGRADLDDSGRFVLQGQSNQHVRPFAEEGGATFGRDDAGRATTRSGPAFEYVDLRKTALPFVLERTAKLVQRGALWKLVRGQHAILGDRIDASDDHGSYRGFDPEGPAVDVADASLEALGPSQAPELAEELATLIDDHSNAVAQIADAFDRIGDTYDAHPGAKLDDPHTFGYDLLEIIEKVSADPDLWASVMSALREPVATKSGEALLRMMRYADRSTEPPRGGTYDRCFQRCQSRAEAKSTPDHPHGVGLVSRYECIRDCPFGDVFSQKTDFQSEDRPGNRSTFQRFIHLVRDATGVPYKIQVTSLEIGGISIPPSLPPVVAFEGAAETFIRSIGGNLKMKNNIPDAFWKHSTAGRLLDTLGVQKGSVADLLSTLSGLFGAEISPEPRPGEITRLMNEDDLRLERAGLKVDASDPVCQDGYVMAKHHADTLYAAEASGTIDAVQPLARAFSNHDRGALFAKLFVIIHRHYSTHENLYRQKNGRPSPMEGTNIASFEGAFDEIFSKNYLFEAVHDLAVAVKDVESAGGISFEERLRRVVHRAAERSSRVEGPDGQSTMTLPGGETVQTPSRLHFVMSTLGKLTAQLDKHPQARAQFHSALTDLYTVFLAVDRSGGKVRFKHPGTAALTADVLRWAADELGRLRKQNKLARRMSEDWPTSIGETVAGRTTSAALELGQLFSQKKSARRAADTLTLRALGNTEGRRRTALSIYRMLVSAAAPPAEGSSAYLGSVLDPDRTWDVDERAELPFLSHVLLLNQRLLKLDDEKRGIALLRRGLSTREGTDSTPVGTLGDIVADYFRVDPSSTSPRGPEDWARVWRKLAVWLSDDVHGLEQFYDLVDLAHRGEPPPDPPGTDGSRDR